MTTNASSAANIKDMLIECISKDVKELQNTHSDVGTANNLVANSDEVAKQLCEHLDHVLLHGLKNIDNGYWAFVRYFTRMDAVNMINKLTQVTTELGKGRAWMYLSLNEQATESYLRMFAEYQDQVSLFYNQEAFLSDSERLLLLQTLITGLDFIYFDFTVDTPYLDYSASEPSLDSGIQDSLSYKLAIEPQFIAKVDQQKSKRPVTTGSLYSQHTTNDRHENYHLKQPTTGTTPLSHSAKLNLSPENLSPEYPLLLGSQPKKKTSDPVKTQATSSSWEHKRHFPENISPSSLPARGPDAVYNVSTVLAAQDDGEIEVTSVRKLKGKKKKAKKKKKNPTESDTQVINDADAQSHDDILDAAVSYGHDNGPPVTGGLHASSLLGPEHDPKATAVSSMSIKSLPNPSYRSQPLSNNHQAGLARVSPRKMPADTLPSAEHGRSNFKATFDAVQSKHTNPYGVTSSQEMPPKTVGVIKPERLSSHPDSRHLRNLQQLSTVTDHQHQQLQDDQHTGRADPHTEYMGDASPQEDSWVKQLFVGREKSTTKADGHFRKERVAEVDKKQFASNTAKFTTMIQDSSSGGDGSAGQSSNEGHRKAVLLPVDGPSVTDVKELLQTRDVTKAEMKAVEMNVDQNTRLIFSLEIFRDPDEELIKLMQVSSPDDRGNRQMAFVLVTNQTVYLLRKDGADHEGLDYSREVGIPLDKLTYLVIGLNWQSVVVAYDTNNLVAILTGNEAVTRTVVEAINKAALNYNQCLIPLNKGDDWRTKALTKEVDKVDNNDYTILLYSLVNWEQLKGELPAILMPAEQDGKVGVLYYKAVMLGMTYWKQGHFVIRKGYLYLYNSENDKTPKAQYSLRDKSCGGCKRVSGERPHSFMVVFRGSSDLVLSANNEEDMLDWTQALCEAVVGKKPVPKNTMSSCIACGALITSRKVCIIKEEWLGGQVKETVMSSCNIDDINTVEVDPLLPLYCIISYDPSERSDAESISWLICFESTHELSKFSIKLAEEWKKTFQIDIEFTEVKDDTLKQRAYKAVDLMQASRYRNDSITRGRGVPLMI